MSDQNRDLYQWDGSDAGQPVRPQGDGGAQQRFRDEAYNPPANYYQPQHPGYPQPQRGYPQEIRQPGRGGDNVMVVYGDVYINQSGNDNCYRCRRRGDGREEYYGRGYDYSQYCQPNRQQWQQQNYYDYQYRQAQPQPNYYDRSGGYYYQEGGNYQRQGPTYSRDSVHGGRDGYSADRERYNSGYERQYGGRPYNQGGCFGGGAYGGGDSYPSDWDRAGQVFDFALKGFDAYAGYDIARRHAKGQYSDNGRNNHYSQGGNRPYPRGGYSHRSAGW